MKRLRNFQRDKHKWRDQSSIQTKINKGFLVFLEVNLPILGNPNQSANKFGGQVNKIILKFVRQNKIEKKIKYILCKKTLTWHKPRKLKAQNSNHEDGNVSENRSTGQLYLIDHISLPGEHPSPSSVWLTPVHPLRTGSGIAPPGRMDQAALSLYSQGTWTYPCCGLSCSKATYSFCCWPRQNMAQERGHGLYFYHLSLAECQLPETNRPESSEVDWNEEFAIC